MKRVPMFSTCLTLRVEGKKVRIVELIDVHSVYYDELYNSGNYYSMDFYEELQVVADNMSKLLEDLDD